VQESLSSELTTLSELKNLQEKNESEREREKGECLGGGGIANHNNNQSKERILTILNREGALTTNCKNAAIPALGNRVGREGGGIEKEEKRKN